MYGYVEGPLPIQFFFRRKSDDKGKVIPDLGKVCKQGDDIVFLRKIVKGGADKSYGVQVAKLAGVPDAVINRAKEIARELEEHDLTSGAKDIMPYGEAQQLSFFRESDEPTMEHPFMAELREKDLSDMTPLEALNYLYVLQEKLKNEE